MAVSTTNVYVQYNGNGATTAFAVTFQFLAASDLVVTEISSAGVETLKTLTTHYTVSGGASGGVPGTGTVTMLTAPASGAKLRIERTTPRTQTTVHATNDAFPAKTVEGAYDKSRLIDQEIGLENELAVTTTLSDYITYGARVLPSPSTGSAIGWAADGTLTNLPDGLVLPGTTDVVTVTNLTALRAITGESNDVVNMLGRTSAGDGGGGVFRWSTLNLSSQVTADSQSGIYVAPTAAPTGASGAWVRLYDGLLNAKWFGAVGDGSTNDTAAATAAAASAGGKAVRFPYASSGYNIANTLVNAGSTFHMEGASQLVGTATAAAAKAISDLGGYYGGMPIADGLRSGKIEIVCGTIQQDSADRTKWNYLNDSTHTPLGVSGVYATASGSNITISFSKTYSKILTFLCGPDETLSNAVDLSCGASVGTSSAVIKASTDRCLALRAYYDGSAWNVATGTGQGTTGTGGTLIGGVGVTSSGSSCTIAHDYLPGIDVAVTPYNVNASIVPKPCAIRAITNTGATLNFYDPSTNPWTLDTTVDTGWAFYYQKRFMGGIILDGTSSSDTYDLDQGNIWFFGLMLV